MRPPSSALSFLTLLAQVTLLMNNRFYYFFRVTLIRIIEKINPENIYFWLAILLAVKAPHYLYRILNYPLMGIIVNPDARDYIGPVENFLAGKGWHVENRPEIRLPGYGLLYLPLRLLMPKSYALYALTILQYFLLALCTYLLAREIYRHTKRKVLFLIFIFFMGFNKYIYIYDSRLYTESFTLSFIMLSFYFLAKYMNEKRAIYLLKAGFFTGYTFFLRPIMLIPWFISGLSLLVFLHGNLLNRLKLLGFYVLPFTLMESTWIYRNYAKYNDFRPISGHKLNFNPEMTHTHMGPLFLLNGIACGPHQPIWVPSIEGVYSAYMGVWGDANFRERGSFLMDCPTSESKMPLGFIDQYLDRCITTSAFNKDSLIEIRQIRKYMCVLQDDDAYFAMDSLLIQKINRYILSIKQERPFYYHVTSRLKLFLRHLLEGPHIVFKNNNKYLSAGILIYYFIFYVAFLLFYAIPLLIGLFISIICRDKEMLFYVFIGFAGLALAAGYSFIFRLYEGRYVITTLPYLAFSGSLIIDQLLKKRKK